MNDSQTQKSNRFVPTKRKLTLLRVISVFCLIISFLVVVPLLLIVATAAMGDMQVLNQYNSALAASGISPMTLALGVFSSILIFVMGVLGFKVRLSGDGFAAEALMWVAGVRLAISVFDFISQIIVMLMGGMTLGDILLTGALNIVLIAADVLILWLAFVFAKQEASAEAIQQEQKARDERFANPKKLGFLRVIQVLFIINILSTLVILCFTSRDVVVYSYTNVMSWINVIFQCIALWFIFKRLRAARTLAILFASFNIITSIVFGILSGQFSPFNIFFNSLFDVVIILYFIFSRRVKTLFTKQISLRSDTEPEEELTINRRKWPFWRNVIMYFCVFSVAGHWMELGYCQLILMGIIPGEVDTNNPMLFTHVFYPFAMEGLVIVMIALFLYPLFQFFKKKIQMPVVPYVVSFVVNTLICAFTEFVGGMIVNADLSLWNYTDMPFNIMGQVCLQNALGFGLAASFITWIVYPLMEKGLAKLSKDAANILFVVIVACYSVPLFLYILNFSGIIDFGNVVFGKPNSGTAGVQISTNGPVGSS